MPFDTKNTVILIFFILFHILYHEYAVQEFHKKIKIEKNGKENQKWLFVWKFRINKLTEHLLQDAWSTTPIEHLLMPRVLHPLNTYWCLKYYTHWTPILMPELFTHWTPNAWSTTPIEHLYTNAWCSYQNKLLNDNEIKYLNKNNKFNSHWLYICIDYTNISSRIMEYSFFSWHFAHITYIRATESSVRFCKGWATMVFCSPWPIKWAMPRWWHHRVDCSGTAKCLSHVQPAPVIIPIRKAGI